MNQDRLRRQEAGGTRGNYLGNGEQIVDEWGVSFLEALFGFRYHLVRWSCGPGLESFSG